MLRIRDTSEHVTSFCRDGCRGCYTYGWCRGSVDNMWGVHVGEQCSYAIFLGEKARTNNYVGACGTTFLLEGVNVGPLVLELGITKRI